MVVVMGDISKNFNRYEFACPCGCGFDTVDVELAMLVEEVREINGNKPITPNSGCRCKDHNQHIGGNKRSMHLTGKAADMPVDKPRMVFDELCRRHPGKYGFGLYETFVHIDSRSDKGRW